MGQDGTLPIQRAPRVSVQTIVVEVIDGPNKGLRAEADDETLTVGTEPNNTLELTDETVSRFHLELQQRPDGIRLEDLGSTNGTFFHDVKLRAATIPSGAVLRVGRSELRVSVGRESAVEVHPDDRIGDLLGETTVMSRLLAQVSRIARTPVAVLLNGESGTGKELLARAIHAQSDRADGPFVTVDCGALTPTLVESTLFGHEKGAFTGADRAHVGAFERANGGTLFLDEVGELPAELQPKLLGALERRRFHRVGAREETSVDVRLVCATHRDLRAEVNAGTFRADLYYRIAVVLLKSPPLRERREDIPMLVQHFLRESGYTRPWEELVPPDVLSSLRDYRWPGNVRELRNWVDATVAMGEAQRLSTHTSLEEDENDSAREERLLELPYAEARSQVLSSFEQRYLPALLEATKHNVSAAARRAEMDRSYLIRLLQRHGLK